MAFETNFSNTDNDQEFRPTIYSPITFKNENSTIDPSELSFRYWKHCLGICISPKIDNPNSNYASYDRKNNIVIYLNHAKARVLYYELEKFLINPTSVKSIGVASSSNCIISIANGKEVGVEGFVVIIRKVDQDGNIISCYMYEFNTTTYFSINNFDETTSKYDKTYYPTLEIETFMTVLKNYIENVPGYISYSYMDNNRKNNNTTYRALTALCDKAGIQLNNSYNKSKQQKSYFDLAQDNSGFSTAQPPGLPARPATLDDLEGEMS